MKKTLFAHIPKTGGSLIHRLVENREPSESVTIGGRRVCRHHLPLPVFAHFLHLPDKALQQDYFKFAFVRNPFDRLVSEYHWQAHPGMECTRILNPLSTISSNRGTRSNSGTILMQICRPQSLLTIPRAFRPTFSTTFGRNGNLFILLTVRSCR
jgi:hypothetical protein